MIKFFSVVIPVVSVLTLLSACGYQQPEGHWVSIEASEVVFSGIKLEDEVKDKAYPDICVEAQGEVKAALLKALPAKIKPLSFTMADDKSDTGKIASDKARFDMVITHCELDVDQGGGSFAFYLTLTVQVSLHIADRTVMAYTMETYEQAVSSTPSPDFEFTFAEPKVRTLMLFDSGRVWVPDGAR
ncbi:MAG: hypothetical protein IMF15_07435 [Proteobacteria bacterium]|nr:hypothetical protein [Pseudomonadota bacterium]